MLPTFSCFHRIFKDEETFPREYIFDDTLYGSSHSCPGTTRARTPIDPTFAAVAKSVPSFGGPLSLRNPNAIQDTVDDCEDASSTSRKTKAPHQLQRKISRARLNSNDTADNDTTTSGGEKSPSDKSANNNLVPPPVPVKRSTSLRNIAGYFLFVAFLLNVFSTSSFAEKAKKTAQKVAQFRKATKRMWNSY